MVYSRAQFPESFGARFIYEYRASRRYYWELCFEFSRVTESGRNYVIYVDGLPQSIWHMDDMISTSFSVDLSLNYNF